MGFPRQEYWSGLPLSSPAGLPDPGTEVSRLAGTLYHLSYTYDTTSCICQHFMYSIKNPVTVCCISLLPPFASLLCTVMCICYKPHATFFLKSFIFKWDMNYNNILCIYSHTYNFWFCSFSCVDLSFNYYFVVLTYVSPTISDWKRLLFL